MASFPPSPLDPLLVKKWKQRLRHRNDRKDYSGAGRCSALYEGHVLGCSLNACNDSMLSRMQCG